MKQIVGADHEFHDSAYAAGWAARFEPTPDRLRLFNLILAELQTRIPPHGFVVELGLGPGYLAAHLLAAMPRIHYCGVDFSRPMLDIAAHRLSGYAPRIDYRQADLVKDTWWTELAGPIKIDAIVSTWALHDLGSQDNVAAVYAGCATALDGTGILLNGDFIKPVRAIYDYEPGRFEIATHLELLHRVGFASAECLAVFEEELAAPTAAQNYACIRATEEIYGNAKAISSPW